MGGSDCGGGEGGVAVSQILKQSRASQGHRRAVLAVVCRSHNEDDNDKDDDDDDDDNGDNDDNDD